MRINTSDFDGEDASAAWLGQNSHSRTSPLLWKTSSPGSPAAIRDGQWKLFLPVRKNGGELALYNIENDPMEAQNLANERPDIVKMLSDKVTDWVATLPKEYIKTSSKDENQ